MISRTILLKLADNPSVEAFVKKNGMSRGLATRFIAGEDMIAAGQAVRSINSTGMAATLDFLGENVSTKEEASGYVDYYQKLFRYIQTEKLDSNVSLKLSQLGLDVDVDMTIAFMESVLTEAASNKLFVRIDMEGSNYTEKTVMIASKLWETHQNVGTVIQSYLYRSEKDVQALTELGMRIRLVKGAYKEPATVAYPDKADVDRNFVTLMKVLLERGNYPAIATHDPKMIDETKDFAKRKGIGVDKFEFQMLYGIRRDLQDQLKSEGYRVRVYVPFGTQWYPYIMRRMAERPANIWFVTKNLLKR